MKNITTFFTREMQRVLSEELEVVLSDEHDYTEDELEALFDLITDELPFVYDGDSGRPLGVTAVKEDMIDVFIQNKLIAFN